TGGGRGLPLFFSRSHRLIVPPQQHSSVEKRMLCVASTSRFTVIKRNDGVDKSCERRPANTNSTRRDNNEVSSRRKSAEGRSRDRVAVSQVGEEAERVPGVSRRSNGSVRFQLHHVDPDRRGDDRSGDPAVDIGQRGRPALCRL